MTAQTKFKLWVIAGGLVLLAVAFLLLESKKEAPIEANALKGDVKPGNNEGKTSSRTGREFQRQTKVAREDLGSLSPEERERFDAAMGEFEIHLRSLEFRNSKLKFHQNLTARSVWHYELLPPRAPWVFRSAHGVSPHGLTFQAVFAFIPASNHRRVRSLWTNIFRS